MWNAIFFVLSATAFGLSLLAASYTARIAAAVRDLPLERLRSIESQTRLLESSVSEWSEITTALSNTLKTMRVRRAGVEHAAEKKNGNAMPDPYTDPDGWRKAMNKRIALKQFTGE